MESLNHNEVESPGILRSPCTALSHSQMDSRGTKGLTDLPKILQQIEPLVGTGRTEIHKYQRGRGSLRTMGIIANSGKYFGIPPTDSKQLTSISTEDKIWGVGGRFLITV